MSSLALATSAGLGAGGGFRAGDRPLDGVLSRVVLTAATGALALELTLGSLPIEVDRLSY